MLQEESSTERMDKEKPMGKFLIVIDPGHYKNYNASHVRVKDDSERGYHYEWVVKGFYEGNNNWEAVNILKKYLEEYEDVEVRLTKKTLEENPDLEARGKQAYGPDWGADLFLSWHSNSADDTDAKGISVFYSLQRPEDKDLATRYASAMALAFGPPTYVRGGGGMTSAWSKDRPNVDYYGVLRWSSTENAPDAVKGKTPIKSKCKHCLIVEHGFHTNFRECDILNTPKELDAIVADEAKFIAKEFGLKKKGDKPKEEPAPDGYYYFVTVEADKYKSSAERTVAKLHKDGYKDAYIKYAKR